MDFDDIADILTELAAQVQFLAELHILPTYATPDSKRDAALDIMEIAARLQRRIEQLR